MDNNDCKEELQTLLQIRDLLKQIDQKVSHCIEQNRFQRCMYRGETDGGEREDDY